jgi:hypothetical protein
MYLGLRIYIELARQAEVADAANFRRPSETIYRVYGLQTAGCGELWKLVVMTGVPSDKRATRPPQHAATEVVGQAAPSRSGEGRDDGQRDDAVSSSSMGMKFVRFFAAFDVLQTADMNPILSRLPFYPDVIPRR